MTRPQYLLNVLDEGLAFERWIEDGHTEECFEAADHMHRVVAARQADRALDAELMAAVDLLEGCPLCRADLQDASTLLQSHSTEQSIPSQPTAEPPPRAAGQAQDKASATPAYPADENTAQVRVPRGRRLPYGLAAVLLACIAGFTLTYLLLNAPNEPIQREDHHPTLRRGAGTQPGGMRVATVQTPPSVMVRTSPLPRPASRNAKAPPQDSTRISTFPRRTARRRPVPIMRRPIKREIAYGYLRIATRPWTRIYINGRKRGTTPQSKLKIPPGHHRLLLINRAQKIHKSFRITIAAGRVLTFTRNFK